MRLWRGGVFSGFVGFLEDLWLVYSLSGAGSVGRLLERRYIYIVWKWILFVFCAQVVEIGFLQKLHEVIRAKFRRNCCMSTTFDKVC